MRILKTFFIFLLFSGSLFASLKSNVRVSSEGSSGNTIANANTSRNVAVSPSGEIYIAWHGSNGIYFAKSTDRGATFSTPKQILATDFEVEIAVSSKNVVYLAWTDSNAKIMFTKSVDQGATFSTPKNIGNATPSTAGFYPKVHMTTFGSNVYLIDSAGATLFYSTDNGENFSQTSTGKNYVFSDLAVNSTTGQLIIQSDDPSVYLRTSDDNGQTLSAVSSAGVSVTYSVGTLSVVDNVAYFFVAGKDTDAYKINVADPTNPISLTNIPNSDTNQGRSISADDLSNLVTGYTSGGKLYFAVSNDLGATFNTPVLVSDTGSVAGAAINYTNGDVMFVYEKNGEIWFATYENELLHYGIKVSTNVLNFESIEQNSTSSTKTLTLTNNGSSQTTVTDFVIDSPFAIQSNGCIDPLDVGVSCYITINYSSTTTTGNVSGTLKFKANGSTRTVYLRGNVLGPVATFDVSELNFLDNETKTVVLKNTGDATLNITSFDLSNSSDFSYTTDCGTTLNPSESCNIYISAINYASGTYSGTFSLTSNTTETAPSVSLSSLVLQKAPEITEGENKTVTMSEDGSPTPFLLTLNATDENNDTLTWSISSPASNGTANASGTGTAKKIIYIPNTNFHGSDSFIVKVDDGYGNSDTITIHVTVQSINDAPTNIALSNNSIDENKPKNTEIGTFSTTDVDSTTFVYTLVSGFKDNSHFVINGNKLETGEIFDFETKSSYTIKVKTDDQNGGTFEKEFTISINDIQHNQTITFVAISPKTYGDPSFALKATASSGLTVAFTSSNTNVATISGSKITIKNAGTTVITASQSGGNDFNPATNVSQLLTVNKALLIAKADNKTKNFNEENPEFTLTITGFVNGDDSSVLEKIPTLSTSATKTSPAGNYDIVPSNGEALNYTFSYKKGTLTINPILPEVSTTLATKITTKTIFAGGTIKSNGGIGITKKGICFSKTKNPTISDNCIISNETNTTFSLSISGLAPETKYFYRAFATNSIGTSYGDELSTTTKKAIKIVENQSFSIDENSSATTKVGKVELNGDIQGTPSYSIINGNTLGGFTIDKTTGIIYVAKSNVLDYETTPVFNLEIKVNDNENSDTKTVKITLNNLDDNAPKTSNYSWSVNEFAKNGTKIGTIKATDADNDMLTFKIKSGNNDKIFAIDSQTGVLTVEDNTNLDFEKTQKYNLKIEISDTQHTVISNVEIKVKNNIGNCLESLKITDFPFVDNATTAELNSSITNFGDNCLESTYKSPDKVYSIDLNYGDKIVIKLETKPGFKAALLLLHNCQENESCINSIKVDSKTKNNSFYYEAYENETLFIVVEGIDEPFIEYKLTVTKTKWVEETPDEETQDSIDNEISDYSDNETSEITDSSTDEDVSEISDETEQTDNANINQDEISTDQDLVETLDENDLQKTKHADGCGCSLIF